MEDDQVVADILEAMRESDLQRVIDLLSAAYFQRICGGAELRSRAREAYEAGITVTQGDAQIGHGPGYERAIERLYGSLLTLAGFSQPGSATTTTMLMAITGMFRRKKGDDPEQQLKQTLQRTWDESCRIYHGQRVATEVILAGERHLVLSLSRQADLRQQLGKRAWSLGLHCRGVEAKTPKYEKTICTLVQAALTKTDFRRSVAFWD